MMVWMSTTLSALVTSPEGTDMQVLLSRTLVWKVDDGNPVVF